MLELLLPVCILLGIPLGYIAIYEWYTGDQHPLRSKPPKKTYLFEDEHGDKRNPFGDFSEGSSDADDREYRYDPAEFD